MRANPRPGRLWWGLSLAASTALLLAGMVSLANCAREWQLNRRAGDWQSVDGRIEAVTVVAERDWLRALVEGPEADAQYAAPPRSSGEWLDRIDEAATRYLIRVRYRVAVEGREVEDEATAPLGADLVLRSRSAAEVIAGTFRPGAPIAVYVLGGDTDTTRLQPVEVPQARLVPWALGSFLLVVAGAMGLRGQLARLPGRTVRAGRSGWR
ncbi:hypothetical protein [Zavarzinia sp. CC-PAN008]|uniref:hypothetical protein n=1 Tax=Zavarzinia sp. CC-PAN008 TaxID=3243332 RepID=UPI003F747BB2